MKKVLSIFCVLALSLLTLVVVGNVYVSAATSDAHTIIANPGEHADTEMNIQWHTDLKNKDSYLLYTKKSDKNWVDAKKVIPTKEECTAFNDVQAVDQNKVKTAQTTFLRCVVNLVDLESDTEYMYKVGQTVMSDVHYFKTGGASEYSAIIISDYHAYLPLPNRLTNAMSMIDKLENYDKSIDFILEVGDTVAYGGCANFWKRNYEEQNYKDYFWCGVNGNHDNMDNTGTKLSNRYYASTHAMPLNGYEGEEGVCYYFVYSDTLFVALDNEYMGADDIPRVQEWAQQAIDNNPTKYIVFMEHYQWFNFVSGSNTHYDRWKEFFDKNGVDLAISGNHHIYGRTNPVKADKEDENGTMYLETSSSDNERGQAYNVSGCDFTKFPSASSTQKSLVKYLFSEESGRTVSGIVLNVNSEEMKVTLLNRNGTVLDTGRVKAKRETPALTIEQKEQAKNDIKFVQNAIGTQVLVLPEYFTGYTMGYEVYNGDSKIFTSNYTNAGKKYASIELDNNQDYDLSVLVKFKDGTSMTYPVKVKTVQNINFINSLNSIGKKLTWCVSDAQSQISKYNVYCNDVKLGEANTNSYSLVNPKFGDVYKVEALNSDGTILDTLEFTYGTFGDVNNDGSIDEQDIKVIQKYINGEEEITSEVLTFADVNGDGKVNIQDACYIKMFKAGFLTTYCKVTHKVKFYGALGELVGEVEVEHGTDAKLPFNESYDYSIVGFSEDYHVVTSDKEIYMTFARKVD